MDPGPTVTQPGAKTSPTTVADHPAVPTDIVAPSIDMGYLAEGFTTNRPFPHIVIDDFLAPDVASAMYEVFPDHREDFWNVYANPLENKLTCNDWSVMPGPIGQALEALNGPDFCNELTALTGIEGLVGDAGLHGGGMHCIKTDGKLDVHIDYRLHPTLGLERRLNLIIYLNRDWRDAYGGDLELWSADMTCCQQRIAPKFNRAVIFATDDTSYHGHPEPLTCPPETSRKSIALYYLTEPRDNATERYRARFVARPQDDGSPEIEEFRKLRSGLKTGPDMYRKDS